MSATDIGQSNFDLFMLNNKFKRLCITIMYYGCSSNVSSFPNSRTHNSQLPFRSIFVSIGGRTAALKVLLLRPLLETSARTTDPHQTNSYHSKYTSFQVTIVEGMQCKQILRTTSAVSDQHDLPTYTFYAVAAVSETSSMSLPSLSSQTGDEAAALPPPPLLSNIPPVSSSSSS